MLAVGLAGFWPVFAGASFIRPAVIGLVAGAVVALFGKWWRWPAGVVALGTIVAYLVLGTAAAVPQQGIAQVVPTGTSLRMIIFGSVQVWRQFITAMTPVAGLVGLTLVPFTVALIGSVVAFSVVWRARRAWLTLIPVAAVFVAVIALGLTQPFFPTVQGLAVAVLAIGWLAWRRGEGTTEASAVRRNRLRNSAILIVAALLIGSFAGPAMAQAADRNVLRLHVVPPLDLRQYPSPLSSFRDLITTQASTDLFTVDNWNTDYKLRLAVMDYFDGTVYNVSDATGASRYDRVGTNLGKTKTAVTDQTATVTVTVDNWSGVWVPSVSALSSLTFSGTSKRAISLTNNLYYNPGSDAVVNPLLLAQGDSYSLTANVSLPTPDTSTPVMNATVPVPQRVPPAVATLAATWAADAKNPYDTVNDIVSKFHNTGYYSDGLSSQQVSLPGHSAARIASLLKNPQVMVGDDEQYAVVAALMLQSLGIPTRVVMGFEADAQSRVNGTTWTVTGADVHAWIEVPFQGYGWVAFDPSPDRNKTPETQSQQANTRPRPQVLTPPVADNDTVQPDSQNPSANRQIERIVYRPISIWPVVGLVSGAVGGPLLVIFGPLLAIGAIKAQRSRTRQQKTDPAQKVVGGWQELIDRAADMGSVMPAAATRRQAGGLLEQRFETGELPQLAADADAAAFGPEPPAPNTADAYWTNAHAVVGQLRRRLSVWGRYRARVSLTSLRRNPQTTVDLGEPSLKET